MSTLTAPRVVFFGLPGRFSRTVLSRLLEADVDVRGVFAPAAPAAGQPPIARIAPDSSGEDGGMGGLEGEESVARLARRRGIPVFAVSQLDHADTHSTLARLRLDAACVACFPKRIPASLIALAPHGFLNVHPSLLPAYRGPHPLFWTFRDGRTATGVTVHWMDSGLDTGDIAAQAPVDLADGLSGAEADGLCAQRGGQLLVEVLRDIRDGAPARRPQPVGGSYQPAPGPDDFAIDPRWPARRAFNFMRGTAEWRRPYRLDAAGHRLALHSAISFSPSQTLDEPLVILGDEAWIQFQPGVLRARLPA